MSGLIKKNNAVKQYMTLARKLQYKPSNVNLRYMTVKQIDAAYKELSKYEKQPVPTKNLGVPKPNKRRVAIINEIKKINPSFKSRRGDTYDDLVKQKKRVYKKSELRKLREFLDAHVVDSEMQVSAKTFIQAVDDFKLHKDVYLRMHADGNYKVLSNLDEFKKEIMKHVNGFTVNERVVEHGSDSELMYDIIEHSKIIDLVWLPHKVEGAKVNKSGAYFGYYNLTEFDLTRYQIYKRPEWLGVRKLTDKEKLIKDGDKENCLIFALRQAGIDESVLNELKMMIFTKDIMARDLHKVSMHIKCAIDLKSDIGKVNHIINQKKFDKVISIGLLENHYFINEPTNITKYTIDNYIQCSKLDSFPSCPDKKGRVGKMLSSFNVIHKMIENGTMFEPITMANIVNKQAVDELIQYDELKAPMRICKCKKRDKGWFLKCKCEPVDIVHHNCKPYNIVSESELFKGKFKNDDKNPNLNYDIIFADTETFIDANTNYHKAYCICSTIYNDKTNTYQRYEYYGLDCIEQFLKSIRKASVIIFHNAGFDFRMFVDYLSKIGQPIESGTKLKQVDAKYGPHKLIIKDSYAFLPTALKNLPGMLQLDSGDKDAYPYTLINENNFDKHVSLNECLEHIKESEWDVFTQNAIKCEAMHGDMVDIKKYTIHYCNQDVRILSQAYVKFRSQIQEVCNLDILKLISLPQLADKYLRSMGCYDGCYSFSGVANDFIRKSCIGGRVMCADNTPWHVKVEDKHTIINGEKIENRTSDTEAVNSGVIQDFDAVSLYPSAMSRLKGFLMGLPKILSPVQLKTFPLNRTKYYDAYYVEIEILKVGIHRDFPLANIKKPDGTLDWTNNLVGQKLIVNDTALDDLIKYQSIKYKVIQGFYFNDGYNDKILETINFIFNERLRLKKEGNPLQNVYKLIMNASYGKLIQKPIKFSKAFVNKEDINAFVARNFKLIHSFKRVNDNLFVVKKKKSIIQHSTCPHIASQILSTSKRIMNEVICTAEDSGIKIYYQDTDSMHLHGNDIPLLSRIYEKKFGRALIGKAMGQFHSDFEVSEKGATDIRAVESIFCAKKLYIDKLAYNIGKETKYDYHIRVKGVPTQAIRDYDDDYMKTYMRLFNGENIEFNLAKYCALQIDADYRARANTRCVSRKICIVKEQN